LESTIKSTVNGRVFSIVLDSDVVYKLKKILGNVQFENLFYKHIKLFHKKNYDPVLLQRTSRFVIDPYTVDNHAFLFGRAVTDMV